MHSRGWELVFYLAVGVGMALGTSAFTMVSGLFQVVPLIWVLAAMALAAGLCAVIALSIGELASMWPSSPAIRTYFKMAFSNRASLVLVYLYVVFIVMIAGVESHTFALVAGAIVPGLSPELTVIVLLGCVIAANLYGLELPRAMQILTAFGCVAIILTLGAIGAGLAAGGAAPVAAETPGAAPFDPGPVGAGLAALPAAVGLAVFLFMGFEWVTPVGLRPQSYSRRIPVCMVAAVGCLLATYAVFAVGIAHALPRATIGATSVPQVPYFSEVAGQTGLYVAGLLSLTAIFSTFNAGLMGGARLLQALAREGVLPTWVARIHPTSGAPIGAVLMLGGLATVSSLIVVTFDLALFAAVLGAAIICLIYAGYMLAVRRLRAGDPDKARPFRTPVPVPLQFAVLVLLPLIGAATLVSVPELGVAPIGGMAVALLVAGTLGWWSARRTPVPRRATPPPPPTRRPAPAAAGARPDAGDDAR